MAATKEVSSGRQIFAISFAAIAATSFCFVLRALVVDQWGSEFALTETQKGELLGVGLWPFAISIILLSLVIDKVGFRVVFGFAAIGHLVGLGIMYTATGYWGLYIGTLIMALANGAVEAAANPLIATVYRHDKPRWLNRLHAAWPGGMIIGGLLAIALGEAVDWQLKIALMALPVLVYTIMLLRCTFPVSERVAAGVGYRDMLAEVGFISALVVVGLVMLEIGRLLEWRLDLTLVASVAIAAAFGIATRSAGRPLFAFLVVLMIPLATTELSTDSWIASLMAPEMRAIGLQPGWVLVYTAVLVFGVRLIAGGIITRFGLLATLAGASALTAVGLVSLASSAGISVLLAASLYGIGKSFFWGTSLALASEQFPKGGSVAINVVAGSGMLAAGVLGSVMLGSLQDGSTSAGIRQYDRENGTTLSQTYLEQSRSGVLGLYTGLNPAAVAAASPEDRAVITTIEAGAKKSALSRVAILPLIMMFSYLGLILFFRQRGGYKPVVLETV